MTNQPPIATKPDLKYLSLLWAMQEQAVEIASLHAELFPRAWDQVAVGRLLAHPGSLALTAGLGAPRRVGGFILAQVAADEAEILTLGVIPSWQRNGIGKRLVDGVMRAAGRAGATSLFLEVAASNQAALALYNAQGFVETGRRKGYYPGENGAAAEDAIVLRANVTGSR